MIERWFPDADTNTVLLLLERESDPTQRADNVIRFVRLRRPLTHFLPDRANVPERRDALEDLVALITTAAAAEKRSVCSG